MNPSLIVANFRDVGATINTLGGKRILKEGVLYRGGTIRDVEDLSSIQNPRTIINLRKGHDPAFEDATIVHRPAPDSVEVYNVTSGSNRKWILSVFASVADHSSQSPFFIHCAAGKDRTGIIIAAILAAVDVERELILADYSLSVGELQPERFRRSLDALCDPNYFRKVDVNFYRKLLAAE